MLSSCPVLLLILLYGGLLGNAQNARIVYPSSHVSGGSRQIGVYSLKSCERSCSSTIGCFGVDYDAMDRSCWFHGTATVCRNTNHMQGTQHIKYMNCLSPSRPHFSPALPDASSVLSSFPGSHVIGGMFAMGITNPTACLARCGGTCYAVDFDLSDNTCWLHQVPSVCNTLMVPKPGSTHYKMAACRNPSPIIPALPGPVSRIVPQSPISNVRSQSSPVTCGRPTISPIGSRIVGGDTAVAHSWPWQVALRNRKSKSVRCAGTIIAPFFILTTAHCVDEDTNPNNWMIYIGAHDLLRFEPTRTMFTVSQVIIHESFDVNTFNNDIALLRLTHPITWTKSSAPVCLPPQNSEIPPGTQCRITGWGVSDDGRRPLKQAVVPIIAPQTCRRADWLGAEFTITDYMICAGYAFGGTDTCQGDSGGPMVCFLNNRWVQAGLTSFGRGCGLPKKPGVYTKVSRYIDWIQRWTTI